MPVCLILGAGFSRAAGLPLTSELFDVPVDPANRQAPAAAYQEWKQQNPAGNAETWLGLLYAERDDPLYSRVNYCSTWDDAIAFAIQRLVRIKGAGPRPYYHGICTFYRAAAHTLFWDFVLKRFDVRYIVTTNYDILVEQALHGDTLSKRSAPDCHYGGFFYNQSVRKMRDVVRREAEDVKLGHKYVLYKLHGSVNWAWERHSPTLKIHDDVRAVFRARGRVGCPAIIPPIPEKVLPPEFAQVWNEAEKSLRSSDTWIVCGYSMPSYDVAISDLFAKAGHRSAVKQIYILDPRSDIIALKWRAISQAEIRYLPGIPDCLHEDWAKAPKV
jgi:hypothetical protein